MSAEAARAVRAPIIETAGLKERILLEAELISCNAQLRNFSSLRDKLSASGQDANGVYRQIESRVGKLTSEIGRALPPIQPAGGRGAAIPFLPGRFGGGGLGLGFSGTAQLGLGGEGVIVVPQGPYPSTGSIYTIALDQPGAVAFDGDLSVGPPEAQKFDPTLNYFWLHNWNFFLVFPPAIVASTFTYSFEVLASATVFFAGGAVVLTSFASVGEAADYTGQPVNVDTGVAWPLIWDLAQPGPLYNGSYGQVFGKASVSRSFVVQGGQRPAVALVLGMVSAQSMQSQVRLDFPSLPDSYVVAGSFDSGSDRGPGTVQFSYQPLPLINHL